jgi:hypothetical protein
LPTFNFRQVGIRPVEFQVLAGPEAGALRGKTMRRASFFGPGGQAVFSRVPGWSDGGAPGLSVSSAEPMARLILRKDGAISEWISFPTDAFSAQRPCFQARSLLLSRKENCRGESKQALEIPLTGGDKESKKIHPSGKS